MVSVGLVAAGLHWWQARNIERTTQLQDFESSTSAFVILSKGSSPFVVEVRVQAMDGNPVPGASVDIRNNSGGNVGTCDNNGRTTIKVAERDVEQILLGGQPVLNRPKAYDLGFPSVEQGLRVLIVQKNAPGIPQKR